MGRAVCHLSVVPSVFKALLNIAPAPLHNFQSTLPFSETWELSICYIHNGAMEGEVVNVTSREKADLYREWFNGVSVTLIVDCPVILAFV